MKDCNAEAKGKALKGDERRSFMSSCLKGHAAASLGGGTDDGPIARFVGQVIVEVGIRSTAARTSSPVARPRWLNRSMSFRPRTC